MTQNTVNYEQIRAVEIQACITIHKPSIHILDPVGPCWIAYGQEYFGDNPQSIFIMATGRTLTLSFALAWLPAIMQWYINLNKGKK